ncbi:MAG: hypothetical protein JW769_05680 [Parachlamydiales bacterium]|nr:hypothetical protein [Parachlamydiales bacterium]
MNLNLMEKMFFRAWKHALFRKKIVIVFPFLVLSGLLVVFCRALAFHASRWIGMSMIFLPIFLVTGIFLALGVMLSKIYQDEIKGYSIDYRKLLSSSWQLIIGTSYLAIPSILVYLLLWIVLGIFILFQQIPGIGDAIGVVFTFLPFLIILGSILLIIFNIGLLFFITPYVAFQPKDKLQWSRKLSLDLKNHFLKNFLLFLTGIIPLLFAVVILGLSAFITDLGYLEAKNISSVVLQWFFMMVPFAFFLTPCVIFFFHFACESFHMRKEVHGS